MYLLSRRHWTTTTPFRPAQPQRIFQSTRSEVASVSPHSEEAARARRSRDSGWWLPWRRLTFTEILSMRTTQTRQSLSSRRPFGLESPRLSSRRVWYSPRFERRGQDPGVYEDVAHPPEPFLLLPTLHNLITHTFQMSYSCDIELHSSLLMSSMTSSYPPCLHDTFAQHGRPSSILTHFKSP